MRLCLPPAAVYMSLARHMARTAPPGDRRLATPCTRAHLTHASLKHPSSDLRSAGTNEPPWGDGRPGVCTQRMLRPAYTEAKTLGIWPSACMACTPLFTRTCSPACPIPPYCPATVRGLRNPVASPPCGPVAAARPHCADAAAHRPARGRVRRVRGGTRRPVVPPRPPVGWSPPRKAPAARESPTVAAALESVRTVPTRMVHRTRGAHNFRKITIRPQYSLSPSSQKRTTCAGVYSLSSLLGTLDGNRKPHMSNPYTPAD